MNRLSSASLVFAGLLRRILRLRGDLWRIAVKEHWERRGVYADATARIEGACAMSGLAVVGPVWLDAYAILFVEDDRKDPSSRGLLRLGRRVYVGCHSNIRAGGGLITLGDNVLVANGVTIVATNHSIQTGHPMMDQPARQDVKDVHVGSDVWIGAHAVLLPGSRVGDGAVIAAGAVVRGEVPDHCIFGGVPARCIGTRGAPQGGV